MEHFITIEPLAYTAFDNDTDLLEKGKEWGLISEKAVKMKALQYKKDGKSLPCEIVGYADKVTAVIRFEDGRLHCIHPSYLKEMQAASFGSRPAAAAESADEGKAANETETPSALSAADNSEESKAPSAAETPSAVSAAAGSDKAAADTTAASDDPPWDTTPADNASESAPAPAAPKAAASPKKSKKEKVELPEGKVGLTATVQEFTTVPNHFSDTDDEVIIYEAVSITDPAVELGLAWSSHSATLKKLELAVGDTITFEAKLVAKKLTKHPVPYKINNPAKIQKV